MAKKMGKKISRISEGVEKEKRPIFKAPIKPVTPPNKGSNQKK